MRTKPSDIADFCHQLALLIRSRLPLPESLRQLAEHFPEAEFQQAIRRMGERTAQGDTLADAMQGYTRFFRPLHIRLIASGEAGGTLADALFSVARFARFSQLITDQMRDIVVYPLLTINVAIVIVFFLSIHTIPAFYEIFRDLFDGLPLPALTALIIHAGMFVHEYWAGLAALYAVFLGFSIWLFTPGLASHKALLAIINRLPGSCRIVNSLDTARMCNLLATFIGQGEPLHEAVAAAAQLIERPSMRRSLERAAQRLQSGVSFVEALGQEPSVDRLVALTLQHAPEKELGTELQQLSELFEHRVTLSVRFASAVWTVFAFVIAVVFVGLVAIGMFVPLMTIARLGC